MRAVASAVCLVFLVLALWHLAMALRAQPLLAALPSIGERPLFVPSRGATAAVGVALLACAALVGATAGLVRVPLPRAALSWVCYPLAAGLLARAVGEFRYLGLFKRVRGTRFATLDTLVYSPLCLLLAAGVALVARRA